MYTTDNKKNGRLVNRSAVQYRFSVLASVSFKRFMVVVVSNYNIYKRGAIKSRLKALKSSIKEKNRKTWEIWMTIYYSMDEYIWFGHRYHNTVTYITVTNHK